jgi:NAD(P)-dependent dehydrogenase (short-subunit alcohol dehydrogenase family)
LECKNLRKADSMAETVGTPGRLDGRVAIVTGGGGTNSIGRAICLRYGTEGAKVAVLDINGEGAARVAAEVTAAGGTAMPVTCDITDLAQCEAAAKKVAEAWGGRIDILVNNAAFFGGMGAWKPFDEWSVDEWDKMQNVNVRGMWFMVRAVSPYMKAQAYGKVINLSSSTFFEGVPGFIHYTTSKGGVIGFTRSIGRELGQYGIRVNAIAPGFTISDAQLELTKDSQEWYERNKNVQALNQRNELPEDLAGPAFFLASPDSDFMSCQTLLVDGGVTPH